ncbi:hypothetical protein PFICI_08222 [Pestalotiopsis fici W106-1]|uniref:Transcription factor domain-containing protein n=1 Tax=Pestalotiopsis fici (strain W106-1 / CGMCC3.15140) TaxID=1229662 RepID=W3X3I1_PESFW|nr:uncharacterized protein PFICI_08222 [Pestalotiopsis fici W106-1]ETS80693.1 hypothetical protein PFICI_08222 [Pestalotiopsis fici W106-1]
MDSSTNSRQEYPQKKAATPQKSATTPQKKVAIPPKKSVTPQKQAVNSNVPTDKRSSLRMNKTWRPESESSKQDERPLTNGYVSGPRKAPLPESLEPPKFLGVQSQPPRANPRQPAPVNPFIHENVRQGPTGGPGSLNLNLVETRTVNLITRILKSWPQLMAMHHTSHLPPMIHPVQLMCGIPKPLERCYRLVNMWADRTETSTGFVYDAILLEIQKLIGECHTYNELDLLPAVQSLLILMIVLFFCFSGPPTTSELSIQAQILGQVWNVKSQLASSDLFVPLEPMDPMPKWKEWAVKSAKQRTLLGLHHVEWVWSLRHGHAILTGFELGPIPAPAPSHLWRETNEQTWKREYKIWLATWERQPYSMAELLSVRADGVLGTRAEMWLAEADEFGTMLLPEINAIQ